MQHARFLLACIMATFAPLLAYPARAQLSPDQTLGAESSVIQPNVEIKGLPADLVEGGAVREANLFHSFSGFSINDAQRVYFDSPAGIDFILSRVTGSDLSTINGLLGTTGDSDAALILMNPNGIVFGENASLDVQGAFTATTASGIRFGENGLFSATDPNSNSLLGINPSAFLFNRQTVQPQILVESGREVGGGLFVLEGETLALLGGDIVIDEGRIAASDVRVELTAIATGKVEIGEEGRSVLLDGTRRGDVRLENASSIDIVNSELAITAEDILVLSGADILVSKQSGRSSLERQADPIDFDATGLIQIKGSGTVIGTLVQQGASESSGNIMLSAKNIEITDGPTLASVTFGDGDSDNLIFTATDNILLGAADSNRVAVFTSVDRDSSGRGGDVEVSTANLEIARGGQLNTTTLGSGNAGDITIEASDSALFGSVEDGGPLSVSVSSNTAGGSTGRGGDVNVVVSNAVIENSAQISTGTSGEADAGNVTFSASGDIRISGSNIDEQGFSAGVMSTAASERGRPGDVNVSAANLEVVEGGIISSTTAGNADAGVVRIDVAETARFDGVRERIGGSVASGVRSNSSVRGSGQGGRVELSATNLEVTNGAQILAASVGEGDAGEVLIDVVETVRLDGVNPVERRFPSGIGSDVLEDGSGDGGRVSIMATNIELTNGSIVGASVFGEGDAGSVVINASGTVRVDGVNPFVDGAITSISSSIEQGGKGQGGNIEITAANLDITDGGSVSTSVLGQGDAGSVSIVVSEAVLVDGVNPRTGTGASSINSIINSDAEGQGGRVEIIATSLNVIRGGQIAASVFGQGDAGDVDIDVSQDVVVSGFNQPRTDDIFPSTIASSVNDNGTGSGGNVSIAAANLEVSNKADIGAFSTGEGNAGSINLNIDNQILIEGDSSIATLSTSDSGGQIEIQSDGIVLKDDGNIRTSVTSNEGTGGNIIIEADYLVALEDSDILSFSRDGRGGDINLTQTVLFSESFVPIDESLSEDALLALNQNNRVDINATGGITSGQISIDNASFIENDLARLTDSLIDTDALIATACVARSDNAAGTLVLRDSDRTTQSPADTLSIPFSTSTVQPVPSIEPTAIQEPQGIYQLANGRLLISHQCE